MWTRKRAWVRWFKPFSVDYEFVYAGTGKERARTDEEGGARRHSRHFLHWRAIASTCRRRARLQDRNERWRHHALAARGAGENKVQDHHKEYRKASAEFESTELHKEVVIPAGGEALLIIGRSTPANTSSSTIFSRAPLRRSWSRNAAMPGPLLAVFVSLGSSCERRAYFDDRAVKDAAYAMTGMWFHG